LTFQRQTRRLLTMKYWNPPVYIFVRSIFIRRFIIGGFVTRVNSSFTSFDPSDFCSTEVQSGYAEIPGFPDFSAKFLVLKVLNSISFNTHVSIIPIKKYMECMKCVINYSHKKTINNSAHFYIILWMMSSGTIHTFYRIINKQNVHGKWLYNTVTARKLILFML